MKQRFSQHMRYYERSLILILMLFSASVMQAQSRTVKGTVSDAQGEPIIGANVVIVGGTKGVITDLDGKYSIQVPENGAVLKFSYIGFKTKSFNVVKGKNVLNVTLEEDAVMLEQTVVTAMDGRSQRRHPDYHQESRSKKRTGSYLLHKRSVHRIFPISHLSKYIWWRTHQPF